MGLIYPISLASDIVARTELALDTYLLEDLMKALFLSPLIFCRNHSCHCRKPSKKTLKRE